MKLNRFKINQMVDRGDINIGGRRSGGGSGAGGGGGVSQQWVDDNYISKEFFSRLFTIHGVDENEEPIVIEPNDTESTFDSIEAVFGLWTEQYVSALGRNPSGGGSGGGGALYLLDDVVPDSYSEPSMVFGLTGVPAADNGKVLTYSGNERGWIAAEVGGGSVTSITLNMPAGMLVNGESSATIEDSGTFEVSFLQGFGLITNADMDLVETLAYYTDWWGATLDNGHVAGAMTYVTNIDGLLYFNMDSSFNYTDVEIRTRLGSDFLFTYDPGGHALLRILNFGDNYDTVALSLMDSELVVNDDPESNSNKSLALHGYNWIDFYTAGALAVSILSSGWVGIGTANPMTMLDVTGGVKAEKFYLLKPNAANDVGAIYFQVEYENSVAVGVHLYGGGLAADTYVSALGTNSSGGGGASSLTQLSDVNPNMNPQTGNVLTYNGSVWTAAAPQSGGSVTKVTAGAGLRVDSNLSGGDITGTGTLSLTQEYITAINNGQDAYRAITGDTIVKKADLRTLVIKRDDTEVSTYKPQQGVVTTGTTLNIISGTGIYLSSNPNNLTISLKSGVATIGTYKSVTVDTYGRVTGGTNPTTLAGYGITDAVVGIVTNVNMIGVKFKDNSKGSWITVPFASTASTATNATTATKLSTVSKTAWGQTYWTSGGVPTSISGNMTSVGNISMSGDITMTTGTSAERKIQFDNSNYFNIRKIRDRLIIKSNNAEVINIYNNQFYSAVKIKTAVGLESNGYVTALATSSSSDERMKNIIEHFVLFVEDIAEAPIVKFTWKNNEDKAVHAGSIAQYWEKKLPESVLEVDGFLTLEYGVLALLSAISLAREVVNLKQRVARIEKELFN